MDSKKPMILALNNTHEDVASLIGRLGEEFVVDYSNDGQEMLNKAMATPPDLILLEPDGPEMKGLEICRRLRSDKRTQNTPVIFINPIAEGHDEAKGLELGATDYIRRPFRPPLALTRIRNAVELKRRGDLLAELAMLDGVTKLPNKQSFEKALTTEWLRGLRSQEPLSLILCNLDEFKRYNDHFGHAMGDDCLITVRDVIQSIASRASDLTARIGWEGFAVILPATDKDGALILAESIRRKVLSKNIPHAPDGTREHITISLGVATLTPSRDTDREFLLDRAIKALNEAKDLGRNRVIAAAEFKKLFG